MAGAINGFAGNVGVEHWETVGTGDGMYNAVDPSDSAWVYSTLTQPATVKPPVMPGSLVPGRSSSRMPDSENDDGP